MLGMFCVRKFYQRVLLILCVSLLTLPVLAGETDRLNLNIDLSQTRILPPVIASYPANDYMSIYADETDFYLGSKRQYPLGLTRFKADKGMRVRGWEIRDNLYFGQAKVGKKWGVGLVLDRGSHYYGLNNRGVSFLKKF